MDIEAPLQVAVVGVPFCVFLSGAVVPPSVAVRGGGNVTVTQQGTGYQICVTPNGTSTALQIFVRAGSATASIAVLVRN